MNWQSLMGNSGMKELTQYPDKRLYKSAIPMRPEDRPTVPVRITQNPGEQFEPYKKYIPEALPEAFILPDHKAIYINGRKKTVDNSARLSAMMGHEQAHITGGDEQVARAKEVQILHQLGKEKSFANTLRKRYGVE